MSGLFLRLDGPIVSIEISTNKLESISTVTGYGSYGLSIGEKIECRKRMFNKLNGMGVTTVTP